MTEQVPQQTIDATSPAQKSYDLKKVAVGSLLIFALLAWLAGGWQHAVILLLLTLVAENWPK